MLTMETKILDISDTLKRKIEMIGRFTNTKPKLQNGKIQSFKNTNIAFVRPHILTINNTDYLIFEECEEIFINGYKEKILFKDLEDYIKSHKD